MEEEFWNWEYECEQRRRKYESLVRDTKLFYWKLLSDYTKQYHKDLWRAKRIRKMDVPNIQSAYEYHSHQMLLRKENALKTLEWTRQQELIALERMKPKEIFSQQ